MGFGAEPQSKSNLAHFSLKIWHLVAKMLIIFLRIKSINWPNFVYFYDYNTVLQESKQASTAYGVCEVWKQERSTLICLLLVFCKLHNWSAWSFFGKFQEEACYWLRPCISVGCQYQCSRLPGKTHFWSDLDVLSRTLKTYTYYNDLCGTRIHAVNCNTWLKMLEK